MIAQQGMAVVLAGGAGRRIGGNKPFYVFNGRPLIEWVIDALRPQASQLLLNAGTQNSALAGALVRLGIGLCLDTPRFEGLGPLSGVHAAILTAHNLGQDVVITAPCDMPNLPSNMIGTLLDSHGQDVDVTYFYGARDYPLCAAWSIALLSTLEAALETSRESGGLSVMQFLADCRTRKIRIDDDRAFVNVNAPVKVAQAG
jgi:molybdenum cofactor guanylyltransferase